MTDNAPTDLPITPDQWLLAQYDSGAAKPRNHVRYLMQVLEDSAEADTPEYPRWSGEARWPNPMTYADLDRQAKRSTA